jgi:hypothetical protein
MCIVPRITRPCASPSQLYLRRHSIERTSRLIKVICVDAVAMPQVLRTKDSMDRVFSYGGNASSIGSVFFECNVWFHLRTIAVVLVHKGLFVNPVLTSHMCWVGSEAGHMPGGIR